MTAFYALDDEERDFWIADWELQRDRCPDCDGSLRECSDPKRPHYPYRRVCYATMERDAAVEAYQDLHKDQPWHNGTFTSWRAERSRSHPYPAGAGVSFGVADRDITPWDRFTTDEYASPIEPSGQGEQEEPSERDEGGQAPDSHRVPQPSLRDHEGDDESPDWQHERHRVAGH